MMRKRDASHLKQQGLVGLVEQTAGADRHAADGIAVIGVLQRQDAVTRLARIAPVAERHLERDLHRRGAAVGEEDMLQPRRRDGDQTAREALGGGVGEAGEDHLVEPVGLLLDGGDDVRVAMAVGDDPPRRDGIEDAAPVRRFEPRALGPRDLQHLGLHSVLRERVPDGRGPPRAHGDTSTTKSARSKCWSNAARKVAEVRGSTCGSRPSRRTSPISAIVRSEIGLLVADEGQANERYPATLDGLNR